MRHSNKQAVGLNDIHCNSLNNMDRKKKEENKKEKEILERIEKTQ